MSLQSILEVRGLSKTFPGKVPFTAVDDVSFSIAEGEIVGLLGPNGAGKTTTILMLLNALSPSRGSVSCFGLDLFTHRSEIMRHTGFASGYARLPYSLTVEENLALYARLFGLQGQQINNRIQLMLEQFGCAHLAQRKVGGLSAGENTRVMLAKAFIGEPKLLLLDEPTASLDPEICHEVRRFIRQARSENKVTVLYTSHNMPEVEEVCDRVIMLKNGRIIATDTPANLAATVGQPLLRIQVSDTERASECLKHLGHPPIISNGWLEMGLAAKRIQPLLSSLQQQGIVCPVVDISHPSLEDYFLKTAGEIDTGVASSADIEDINRPKLEIEKELDLRRSIAVAIRYLHNFKRNFDRLSDAVYWPIMDLILWGLATSWFVSGNGDHQHTLMIMLTAIVFWQIVWRANYEISINLLEESWSRNIVNMFSTPLTLAEWITGVMIVGLCKTALSIIVGFGTAWLLYSLNLLTTGFLLVPFLSCLILFGWGIGLCSSALIIRFGRPAQTLAWTMGYLTAPLCAVFYPVTSLPSWLQPLCWSLPATWIFEGMRSVISTGEMNWRWLALSFALNLVFVLASLLFFAWMFEKRKLTGLQGLES